MTYRNSTLRYGSVAIFFHWLIAFAVIGMLMLGFFMDVFPKGNIRSEAINIHKLIGLTILCLVILRLTWALTNVKPPFPAGLPTWQRYAERIAHVLFYILLLTIPMAGWIMSTASGKAPHFFHVSLPAPGILKNEKVSDFFWTIHSKFAWVILVLIIIHALAALRHHFIIKDDVLRRMWFKKENTNENTNA